MTASSFWRLTFWGCAATVLFLSLAPASPELPTTGWDKSNHFIGFFALAMLGVPAYLSHQRRVFIALLLFGGLIELLQSLTPYRLAEWADWVADGMGVVAGFGLHWLLHRLGFGARRAS